MSRLLSAAELSAPVSQLPPAAYFDEALLVRERELLFARGPGYVGHELMVPNAGDYAVLASRNNAHALFDLPASGVKATANTRPRRQASLSRWHKSAVSSAKNTMPGQAVADASSTDGAMPTRSNSISKHCCWSVRMLS